MRTTLYLFAIALPICLTACSKSPKERLEGRWTGESVSNVTPAQDAEASAWAKGVKFEFDKSKMTVAIPAEQPRTGDFDIEDAKDGEVTIRVAREGGGADTAKFKFDGDELHWDVGDGRAVVLARAD